MRALLRAALLMLPLAACQNDPVISPHETPDPRLEALYIVTPQVRDCFPGVIDPVQGTRAVDAISQIRALHGLLATRDQRGPDTIPAQIALYAVANRGSVPSGGLCERAIMRPDLDKCLLEVAPLLDTGQVVSSAWLAEQIFLKSGTDGRRILLDPFLKDLSFARVDGPTPIMGESRSAGSLYLGIPTQQSLHGWLPRFVAYPFGDYPERLFDSSFEMFFFVVPNKEDRSVTFASFESARISVKDEQGRELHVTVTTRRNQPNLIGWHAPVERGIRYWVSVSDVLVGTFPENISYSFMLQ
jgi:hypothetical protein